MAGYYSKDMILESAFAKATGAGEFAYWIGVVAAVMTAFYSCRLMFMTFHGEARASQEVMSHVHESPLSMTVPLAILAVGSVLAGALFAGYFIGDQYAAFWGESILMRAENTILVDAHNVPTWVKIAPVVAGIIGIAISYLFYIRRTDLPDRFAKMHREAYLFLLNKWYFDELYDLIFVRPAKWLGRILWTLGDGRIIDGFGPDGIAASVLNMARRATMLQTGYVYHYAFVMMVGVAGFVTWYYTTTGGGH